ncbi:hydrolase [Neobacillus notoginsengisoli]|uniref:Hydrolase n=1 Tax=Neobacillus notoginsengisoli TaxID=1578198 RepID=A0A417YYS3_9BACI|nr:C39 family peptidase [Neobacillus notoginsengisoli]RHW42864.1 hydrolase [Neobacillus notoginsengisoli]
MKKFFGYAIVLLGIIVLTGFFLLPKQEIASVSQNKENVLSAAEQETPIAIQEAPKSEIKLPQKAVPEKPMTEILLDVPFLNQMATPRLYNGCEVTSLAMILKYKGIEVTKNELAKKVNRVPLRYQNGQYGNPYTGFVGNMEDGPGLGVYHGPIFTLAKEYAGSKAEDLTGKPFDTVIEKLAEGTPVWVIINTAYAPLGPSHFKTWNTPEGQVKITFTMHSVALTGFDEKHIFLNDPYGTKDRKVNRANFIKAWEQMGSQAVVIN